jgi:diacylglycerol kinase (ATP)
MHGQQPPETVTTRPDQAATPAPQAKPKTMGPPPRVTGIKRIINAFHYSRHGLRACFKTEDAFRQEVFLAAALIPAAFLIAHNRTELILLIGTVLLVMIVELLNTGIERAIDRISFERHDLSKEAKDMGSAAVLLALILAGFTWILIMLPG